MKNIHKEADMLAEIVEKMCGSIRGTGRHEVDTENIENCKTFYNVVDCLLDDIQLAMGAAYYERWMNSVGKIYNSHRNKLVEIRDQINEWLDEYEE